MGTFPLALFFGEKHARCLKWTWEPCKRRRPNMCGGNGRLGWCLICEDFDWQRPLAKLYADAGDVLRPRGCPNINSNTKKLAAAKTAATGMTVHIKSTRKSSPKELILSSASLAGGHGVCDRKAQRAGIAFPRSKR